MLRKSLLILLTIFAIICITNICYASDMGNSIKNAVNSGTDTLVDGVSNLAGSVRNGIGHVENGVEDALTMDDSDSMNLRNDNANTNIGSAADYSATRAATTFDADNTTMWVWLILGIAAIVIVALVWYYGSQNRID